MDGKIRGRISLPEVQENFYGSGGDMSSTAHPFRHPSCGDSSPTVRHLSVFLMESGDGRGPLLKYCVCVPTSLRSIGHEGTGAYTGIASDCGFEFFMNHSC